MRGADVAEGHAVERMRRGFAARSNRARALAGNVAEGAPERAQTFPAGAKCDIGDGQIGVAEQRHRSLDAPREQIPMRRSAKGLLERSGEVRFGNTAHARQSLHGPVLMRGGVHPVLRSQQATQQLGVLAWRRLNVGTVQRLNPL